MHTYSYPLKGGSEQLDYPQPHFPML